MAVTTVYLGGRQEVIDAPEKISKNNALYAPIEASLAIGGLYLLLKAGIDIPSFYAIMVTLFGALAISDIGVPILRNVFPNVDFANAEVPVPQMVAEKLDRDKPESREKPWTLETVNREIGQAGAQKQKLLLK